MHAAPRQLVCGPVAAILIGCLASGSPAEPPPAAEPAPQPAVPAQPFPHIRIDREARTIELDGVVPIDAHAKATTKVYLEVIACSPDTKEHEALVLTKAKASHLHAALLLLDLVPGRPGAFEWKGQQLTSTAPDGPALSITLHYTDAAGRPAAARPQDWVLVESTGKHLADADPPGRFLFAGSKIDKTDTGERYRADLDGTLIGLTTFGSEAIAWSLVYSPQADVQEPDWLADRERVPPYNTPVTIRIRPADAPEPTPDPEPAPAPKPEAAPAPEVK